MASKGSPFRSERSVGFGDAVAGHKLARASLTAFLDGVARRLEDEVDRRIGSVPKHRAPDPIAVTDRLESENHIG